MSIFTNVNPMSNKRKQTTKEYDAEFSNLKFARYQNLIQHNLYKAKAYWVIGVQEMYIRGMSPEEIHNHTPPISDLEFIATLSEKMDEDKEGHCPDLKERLKVIIKIVPFLYYFPGSLISYRDLQVCPGVIGENGSLNLMKKQGFSPFLVKSNVETDLWAEGVKRRTRFQHGASAVIIFEYLCKYYLSINY